MKKKTLIIIEGILVVFVAAMAVFFGVALNRSAEPEPEYYGTSDMFEKLLINGVYVSEIKSLRDVSGRLNGKAYKVKACNESNECKEYDYDEFFGDQVDKSDVKTIGVKFSFVDGQTGEFWLFYADYLRIGDMSKYYDLIFRMHSGVIMLEDRSLEKFNADQLSSMYGTKINGNRFEVKSSDYHGDLTITGYVGGAEIEIYNDAEYRSTHE